MGYEKELGYTDDEYPEESESELVCLDLEERLGFANVENFPPDYDVMETLIELLLRREESAVPWPSVPILHPRRHHATKTPTPLFKLPVDILLLIYDQLSIHDAICLALTNTVFYNLSRNRLYGIICPKHLGNWAGKRLTFLDDTVKFRSSFKMYPAVGERLKQIQRGYLQTHPNQTRWGHGHNAKKAVDTPFKLVSKFPNRLPWNSPWNYDPTKILDKDVNKTRLRTLGPDLRRMQSLWYDWQAGKEVISFPFRRFIEGFMQRSLHLSLLTDESYVLRNLDKGLYVRLDGCDAREMVRNMVFGPDGSKRGKLSPGYNKWCGDRFDIIKTETMLRESGWKDARAAGPAPEDPLVQILRLHGII
ncbi:hypothetical protein TWF694_005490 [Orbilia ellipsospora]|uniref:F-box domain-containing protein n=1 Tax=Orbilia ellipsospora TaxID=2528407 RepID=A0AAV9WTF0_9PEZI